MYIPGVDSQLAITELIEIQPENLPTGNLPNVTKEISDVLKLCDTAGLDPHGVGCGMSIALVLILASALLFAVIAVLIPAIISLLVGIIGAIGSILAVLIAGFTALVLGIVASFTAVFAIICRGVVKVISLPFRPCISYRDPVSPLDSPAVGGVVDGQIRYVREAQSDGRPPSYHSDTEAGTSNQPPK